jgi:hypothetical protein
MPFARACSRAPSIDSHRQHVAASATPSDGSAAYSQQELAVSATANATVPRMRAEGKGHGMSFVGLLKRVGAA